MVFLSNTTYVIQSDDFNKKTETVYWYARAQASSVLVLGLHVKELVYVLSGPTNPPEPSILDRVTGHLTYYLCTVRWKHCNPPGMTHEGGDV